MAEEIWTSGTTPQKSDTERVLLLKQLNAVVAAGSSGLTGTGSPEGVVTASPGATYLDTDTDALWVKKSGTGNTGWLELLA